MSHETSALSALLYTKPVRTGAARKSAVRKIMDENRGIFEPLAAKGYMNRAVVDAFISDFPDVRHSRPNDDDNAYRTHIEIVYAAFKRSLKRQGIGQPRKAASKSTKAKAVNEAGHTSAATSGWEPVSTAPEIPKPTVVKPSTGGFPIPKAKDF